MRLSLSLLALVFVSAPALADHTGPTGVDSGGGVNVIGPGTLDEGATAISARLTFSHPDQRSDAELEALAAQHIHAHNTDYNLIASLGAAYGVTHRLTVSAELPYMRRANLREGEHSHVNGTALNEVVQLGDVSGIGDLSILAKYRLSEVEDGGFALIAGIKVPTGSTHRRDLAGERLEIEHQPGTGSWDPIIGAAAGVALGPVDLSASVLYQFSGKGTQDTSLGDRAQGGIALSHHFGPVEHDHDVSDEHDHDHGHHEQVAPHFHQSLDAFVELTVEWEGRQRVDGMVEEDSGGKAVWLTPGARFNTASGISIAGAVGIPVWQHIRASHPDNGYRITLSVGRTF